MFMFWLSLTPTDELAQLVLGEVMRLAVAQCYLVKRGREEAGKKKG